MSAPMVAIALVAGVVLVAPDGGRVTIARSDASAECADACTADRIRDTRPPARDAPPVPVVDAVLEARLPLELGDGFVRVADDEGASLGPLDLERAAAAEPDASAERSLLETRHFDAGHARAWRHGDGRLAYAAVYRFAAPEDADAYLIDGLITLVGRGARTYDVADPIGAKGFSQAESEVAGGDLAHGVVFARGQLFFLVFETASASAAGADDAQRFARIIDAWQARSP